MAPYLVDLSVEVDEHGERNDAQDNEPAPVKVSCVDWVSTKVGRQGTDDGVIQCLVCRRVHVVLIFHFRFKKSEVRSE